MTKTYALKRLLEHGPLKFTEIVEITGWDRRVVWRTLGQCRSVGLVTFWGPAGKSWYELA